MIDDALVQGIMQIANYKTHKKYPMLSEDHYKEDDVKIILESYFELIELWEEKKHVAT